MQCEIRKQRWETGWEGERGGVPHQSFLFDLSPLHCALTHNAAGPPLSLAVISATHHDYLDRRPIWPPVTTSPRPSPEVTGWSNGPKTHWDMTDDCRPEAVVTDALWQAALICFDPSEISPAPHYHHCSSTSWMKNGTARVLEARTGLQAAGTSTKLVEILGQVTVHLSTDVKHSKQGQIFRLVRLMTKYQQDWCLIQERFVFPTGDLAAAHITPRLIY